MTYHAILFSLDAAYVCDFLGQKTKQDVLEKLENMGSRWFFYPFWFVTTGKTIVGTPCGMENLKGMRVKTLQRMFKQAAKHCPDSLQGVASGNWPPQLLPDILKDAAKMA